MRQSLWVLLSASRRRWSENRQGKPMDVFRENLPQYHFLFTMRTASDRLCGLVVRVLGYRSGGPGSIPGTNRKKKKISGSGTGSTQPREYKLRSYLIEK
jgi:hypothetical protein